MFAVSTQEDGGMRTGGGSRLGERPERGGAGIFCAERRNEGLGDEKLGTVTCFFIDAVSECTSLCLKKQDNSPPFFYE